MKELLTETPFSANLGLSANMNQERMIIVNLGTGTVDLQVNTLDGWVTIKNYAGNTAEGFSFRNELQYQFLIAGNAKVYLV